MHGNESKIIRKLKVKIKSLLLVVALKRAVIVEGGAPIVVAGVLEVGVVPPPHNNTHSRNFLPSSELQSKLPCSFYHLFTMSSLSPIHAANSSSMNPCLQAVS